MTNYKTFTEMEYRHLESERDSLRKQLAKFQESEFHPDFSMLEATRESLREHMAMYKALANENEWLRAELAAARATIAESKAFIEKSFEVHPNLDLDVAAIDAAMKEGK